MKPLSATIAIAGTMLLVSACQMSPRQTTAPEEAAPEERGGSRDSRPEMAFPKTELVISCPDPDPVALPACPPPPPEPECPACPESGIDGKMMVGGVEEVRLKPPGITYNARIDSGATGTSLHATDIVPFERDGESWVRFTMNNPDGEPLSLERPVERRVRIRQAAEQEKVERRIVVMMDLSLGSLNQQVEISLTNRSEMDYPVLVGRNVLRNNAVVDVSREFIAR